MSCSCMGMGAAIAAGFGAAVPALLLLLAFTLACEFVTEVSPRGEIISLAVVIKSSQMVSVLVKWPVF